MFLGKVGGNITGTRTQKRVSVLMMDKTVELRLTQISLDEAELKFNTLCIYGPFFTTVKLTTQIFKMSLFPQKI